MRKMQIHIVDIRPVFWPRNEMGSSGWCVPSSTSGPQPNTKDSRSEQMPITAEDIVSMLRTGEYLGEARNVVDCLCCLGDP